MNQSLQRPKKTNDRDNRQNHAHTQSSTSEATRNESENIVITMTNKINNLPSSSLSFYTIKELVEDTEKLGKHLVRDVKTTQIRKFLDAANRLRFHPDRKTNFTTAIKGELQLLRPKLAYAVGRQSEKNKGIKDLQTVIECAIKKVNTPDDFIRFLQLIESIVAYHKFAGGKDQ